MQKKKYIGVTKNLDLANFKKKGVKKYIYIEKKNKRVFALIIYSKCNLHSPHHHHNEEKKFILYIKKKINDKYIVHGLRNRGIKDEKKSNVIYCRLLHRFLFI